METRRIQVEHDFGYTCSDTLVFSELNPEIDIRDHAEGTVEIRLSEKIPHPVEIGIKDVAGEEDAEFASFDRRSFTVEDPNSYPISFQFTTGPSANRGAKWYYYRTANWKPNIDLAPRENPEYVQHHISIPPAQVIRLCHCILSEYADRTIVEEIAEYYDRSKTNAAWTFSSWIKRYIDFESRMKIIDFLNVNTGMSRSSQDLVNSVVKHILQEENRNQMNSVGDIERLVEAVNMQCNLPNITTRGVVSELISRVEDKNKLEEIASQIGIEDWSRLLH